MEKLRDELLGMVTLFPAKWTKTEVEELERFMYSLFNKVQEVQEAYKNWSSNQQGGDVKSFAEGMIITFSSQEEAKPYLDRMEEGADYMIIPSAYTPINYGEEATGELIEADGPSSVPLSLEYCPKAGYDSIVFPAINPFGFFDPGIITNTRNPNCAYPLVNHNIVGQMVVYNSDTGKVEPAFNMKPVGAFGPGSSYQTGAPIDVEVDEEAEFTQYRIFIPKQQTGETRLQSVYEFPHGVPLLYQWIGGGESVNIPIVMNTASLFMIKILRDVIIRFGSAD